MSFSPKARHKARAFAMQALYEHAIKGGSVQEVIEQGREKGAKHKVEWEFYDRLVAGVLEDMTSIDEILSPLSDRPFDETHPVEKALLQLATFELRSCPDIPEKVIMDEYIELAHEYGAEASYKFINGVLDKCIPLRSSFLL